MPGWTGLLLWSAAAVSLAAGQSNYASRGNSIEYSNEGLPDSTVLDGKVTKLDDLSPVIFLNRTKAFLNCAAGLMQIELKFDEPFTGIVYADFDRASPCQTTGRGELTAKIDLPLKGCGTKQDPQRVFTNNIVVRFHPALEMDGDEVITIVCRYPPPIAPPPALPPAPILQPETPLPLAPPLKGFQILLIICGILFLSLVLLGLGCSYYMLRRRRVQVVRRHPLSMGTGSDITKLSGSSLGNISMFEGLKIPRAHAQGGSTSGSEAALISDTLPSDYPSESPSSAHSEMEQVDQRSLSSRGSYENKAYIQDSYYTEEIGQTIENQMRQVVGKRPPPDPKFDVQVRVKKAAPPPPSPTPPPSDSEMSMRMSERNLTTILEEGRQQAKTTFTFVPEIHSPPPSANLPTPPPIYSTVMRKHPQESKSVATVEEKYLREDVVDYRRPSLASLGTEMTEARSMTEIVERSPTKISPPPPPVVPQEYVRESLEETVEIIEPPLVVSRRPEIKSHVVDDVFLRTITEKRTIEDIERQRRQVTDYRKPLPTKWDVTIRNYPGPDPPGGEDSATDWESYSETSSISAYQPPMRNQPQYRSQAEQWQHKRMTELEIENIYRSTLTTPPPEKPHNWDVLVRVLEPPQYESADDRSEAESVTSVLTIEDRKKWQEIITTESSLRTMLTEASVKEDYERIRRDQRYEKLFEPQKWDVIIRVLAPPPGDRPQYDQRSGGGSNKYRRKADWDTRSRRSSLPTLYEYDSDGGSSIRTLTTEGTGRGGSGGDALRSRRTSRASEMDLRSMSEVTVDMRAHIPDDMSDVSSYKPRRGYYDEDYEDARSLVRSMSQPSLARSGSEFTEQWAIGSRHWDSPQHSPRSGRSRGFKMTQESTSRYQRTSGWFGDADSEASFK